MAVEYDLTAVKILHLLGIKETVGKARLEAFERENKQKLPKVLFDFLSVAMEQSLFSTADIYTDNNGLSYFYEWIEEEIGERQEDWAECPEECFEDPYFPFSQIPKEQWPEHVCDYLLIGSDYGVGVVSFGIRKEDLSEDNPAVYVLNEAEPLTEWKLYFDKLEDYLVCIVCDILACRNFSTAQRVLKNTVWNVYDYESQDELNQDLLQRNIHLSEMKKYCSQFADDVCYRCCYDQEEKVFYLIKDVKRWIVFSFGV